VAPRYGAYGVAWVVSVSITAVRGAFLAVLMCRVNGFALADYLRAIYLRPLLTGAPVIAMAAALRLTVLPGTNWPELITAGALVAIAYFAIAFFSVLDGGARGQIVTRIPGSHRLFSKFA